MLKTTILHLTVNSTPSDIGGKLVHTTPATPSHQVILEAVSAAFSKALEDECAKAAGKQPEAAFGDRAAMATRLNLLIKRTNPKPYNDAVLDCINSLKN